MTADHHFIQAAQLRGGDIIVSAYHEWESDGRLKLGEPYHVNEAKLVTPQSNVVSVTKRGSPGEYRTYEPNEPVIILHRKFDAKFIDSAREVLHGLATHGHRDEAKRLERIIQQHNVTPAERKPLAPR